MKAKREFASMHQDCITIVRGIKLKNDIINRKHGIESQSKLLLQIQKDKSFFQSQLSRLKILMTKMEENYLDPDSVRKLQGIKKEAKKQIDRNEQLIRQLVNSSFVEIQHHEQEMQQYENAIRYDPSTTPKKITSFNPYDDNKTSYSEYNDERNINRTQILIHDEPVDNFEIEQRINKEKIRVMDEVAREFIVLNGIINQTAVMIHEQGQNLDIITEDLVITKKNIEMGNAHLLEANQYQKKTKTKYIVFALLIILIALLIGVPVIMLT